MNPTVYLAAVGVNCGLIHSIDSVSAVVFDQAAGQRDHAGCVFVRHRTKSVYAAVQGLSGR